MKEELKRKGVYVEFSINITEKGYIILTTWDKPGQDKPTDRRIVDPANDYSVSDFEHYLEHLETSYDRALQVLETTSDLRATIIEGAAGELVGPVVAGIGALNAVKSVGKGLSGLAHASRFGIQAYKLLKIIPAGCERHHLIPQRFSVLFGESVRDMKCIVVTIAEHQVFTKKWRDVFNHGADTAAATKEAVLKEAKNIYKDYPEILKALGL
jgi:hypothetical protein